MLQSRLVLWNLLRECNLSFAGIRSLAARLRMKMIKYILSAALGLMTI